jgi:hypothetical protein
MSGFELPKDLNDLDPKQGGAHTDSDGAEYLNFDTTANSAPFSPPMNSTVNLHGHNDKPRHSRLDEIAEALRTLTYGEMLELAESMWKVNSQGIQITESDLPNVLYRWSKSRGIKNRRSYPL